MPRKRRCRERSKAVSAPTTTPDCETPWQRPPRRVATGALDKALLRRYEALLAAITADPSQLAVGAASTGALHRALQQWDEALLAAITADSSQLAVGAAASLVVPARPDDPTVVTKQA